MIFTNVLINQLKGDKTRKQNAREELWKAQDSCLLSATQAQKRNELRKAAYSSLLRSEQLSREKGKFVSSLIQYDFDFDGRMEYLFQDTKLNCYIQLKGAAVFELDYLPKEWNYLDCGSTVSSGGTSCARRSAFADAIVSAKTKPDELGNGYLENARLCFNEQYEALSQDRKGKSCFKLSACDGLFGSVEINKCYSLKKDILSVSYNLKNTSKEEVEFAFVPEIVFSFAGEGDEFARFYSVENGRDSAIEKQIKNTDSLKILDVKNEVQILLGSTSSFCGCLLPVHLDGHYQATRILPLFKIALDGAKSWTNDFSLKFSH